MAFRAAGREATERRWLMKIRSQRQCRSSSPLWFAMAADLKVLCP